MRVPRLLFVLLVVGLTICAGCGRSDRSPLGRVAGTVQYNGQPVAAGTLVFEVPGARPANGTIADGEIVEVTTYVPRDGVPVGEARIAVFATPASGVAAPANPAAEPGAAIVLDQNYMGGAVKSLIPSRYNDPATSGLTWTIQEGENVLDLNLSD
jgi:hypothetical protein